MPSRKMNRKSRRNSRRNSRKNRKATRRQHKQRGSGYLSDQQFFNPQHLSGVSYSPNLSTAPTSNWTRPILPGTYSSPLLSGGRRRFRR